MKLLDVAGAPCVQPSTSGLGRCSYLGVTTQGKYKGQTPASIWQLPQRQECIDLGAVSIGIRQSDFGMPYAKPTRLLVRLHSQLPESFFKGKPSFSEHGVYTGPIPQEIGQLRSLAKTRSNEAFLTTGTAAWPPLLCQTLSSMVLEADPAGGIIAHSPMDTPAKQDNFPVHLPPAVYI